MIKSIFPSITENEKKLPFYMTTVGHHQHQGPTFRPLGAQDYHWIHCLSGKGKLVVNGKQYVLEANCGFFSYPNIMHEYYPIEEPWETCWLTFNGFTIEPLLEQLNFERTIVFSSLNLDTINQLLNSISLSYIYESFSSKLNCSVLIYQFICELRNRIHQDAKSNYNLILLEPVIEFIKSNYYKPISIDDLSQAANITPQHLCRVFNQTYHARPFEYINRYRMNIAKEIMHNSPAKNIHEIAQSVGFSNAGYFSSVFKKVEGISPMEFKKMYNHQFDKFDLHSSKT